MSAEIKTMTLDDAGTQIIYPRTKQTAISDANGNTMGEVGFYGANTIASGISVPSLSVPRFIDVSNVIATGTITSSSSYTATQDCMVYVLFSGSGWAGIFINTVEVASIVAHVGIELFLKQGQVIKANDTCSYKAFGLQD